MHGFCQTLYKTERAKGAPSITTRRVLGEIFCEATRGGRTMRLRPSQVCCLWEAKYLLASEINQATEASKQS